MRREDLDLYLKWEAKAKILGILDDYDINIKNKNIDYINEADEIVLEHYNGTNKKPIMPPVHKIGNKAFKANKHIKNITIPKSVICIGDSAFAFCSQLKSVNILGIPNMIKTRTFYKCVELSDIKLNTGLIHIHSDSFYGCKNLRNIKIPDTVEYIADRCFGYTGLENIVFPETLHDIGSRTFIGCDYIENIIFKSKNLQIHGNFLIDLPRLNEIIVINEKVYINVIRSLPEKYKSKVKINKGVY